MTERESRLISAATCATGAMGALIEALRERKVDSPSARKMLEDLIVALRAYSEPPNEVFSQQVTWDSRAPSDASIGHTATAIGEER